MNDITSLKYYRNFVKVYITIPKQITRLRKKSIIIQFPYLTLVLRQAQHNIVRQNKLIGNLYYLLKNSVCFGRTIYILYVFLYTISISYID